MDLGPMEIALAALAFFVLFGYKRLPDASRALGRSMRIFKSEMKGMHDDDTGTVVDGTVPAATAIPVAPAVLPPAPIPPVRPAGQENPV